MPVAAVDIRVRSGRCWRYKTVMDITLRPITDDELQAFVEAEHTPFSDTASSEDVESIRSIAEIDRTLAAFDGEQIVATAGIFSFELTVPGPRQVPAAGVT